MQGTAFFSCESLSLNLGGREVLRDIGFELRPGEVLGIIGPNGAGKTSLLEILSGRFRPKTGKVLFEGRDITALPLFQRARLGIGRTYQTPLVPEELTVGDTFKAARQAFEPWLTRFDAEYGANLVRFRVPYDRPTVNLKTFERRKLLMATLLMRQPKLLLMDEPAAGLINAEIDEIDQILRMLSKEMNVGIIIVEHRIELLESIADRVVVMDAGEIIARGALSDIIDSEAVRAAYFEAH
ncbi:branched-chain amino acid ABC transporter ATP-binding protein [Rhodopseudomonas sp. AAP120]|uniref:ABC transporter ATP-binding protein n=1 Tax=Rhodopseudomonas sp. AAP120 TaxID=1523430 RepID=UPI0006B9045A|nr:ATP-binding cassette domain-containing protein [Rhodopseudomonas sp. AAP120]KPG02216.1 branched-chain amino acid ABC transporter ATP-binding protein [Rhodopseudomonas sp. AAP120]